LLLAVSELDHDLAVHAQTSLQRSLVQVVHLYNVQVIVLCVHYAMHFTEEFPTGIHIYSIVTFADDLSLVGTNTAV